MAPSSIVTATGAAAAKSKSGDEEEAGLVPAAAGVGAAGAGELSGDDEDADRSLNCSFFSDDNDHNEFSFSASDEEEETRALFSFSSRLYRCSETDGCVEVDVVRHGNTQAGVVSVSYFTKDGTALAELDYVPREGTLVFAPGETVKTVRVSIVDDEEEEQDEYFKVQLHSPSPGAHLGNWR
jgi:hypothetical protein